MMSSMFYNLGKTPRKFEIYKNKLFIENLCFVKIQTRMLMNLIKL